MTRLLDPASPLSPAVIEAVGTTIASFLTAQEPQLCDIGAQDLLPVALSATAGGKRLRPGYCYWGRVAVGGYPDDDAALLKVASSLDLLHVSALVHDDLIDDADTRRGQPAAHKHFEALHAQRVGRGDAAAFGTSSAILLGDLLLMWSIQLADESGADGLDRARTYLTVMRSEVTAGQFLDVSAQYCTTGASTAAEELEVALRVLEYKSARYSIRRPTQIGAALGGADAAQQRALGTFGSLVGRAFQLRDDVLGVYGAAAVTGKPYGGDIHEGKRTVLVLKALAAASEAAASELESLLGRPGLTDADVARAADIIDEVGARAEVEGLISHLTDEALEALATADLHEDGRTALAALARKSVHRDS